MRDGTVTIRLFHQLESFSSYFAHLKTKLDVHPMLYHCKLSQQSARYKNLNTTDNEQQERSD
jgi:hypothetical protein